MLIALSLMLLAACYYDCRWRVLPNWLTLSIFVLGMIATGVNPKLSMLSALFLALLFLVVGLGVFACKWLGAGDIKLIVALAPWLQVKQTVDFVVGFTLLGGLMAIAVIIYNRYSARFGWTSVKNLPYGLAICGSAFWLLLTP